MTTSRSAVDEQISALDALVGELRVAIAAHREGSVDWDDVDTLGHLHEHLAQAARTYDADNARVELRRAARKVAMTVRQLASTKP